MTHITYIKSLTDKSPIKNISKYSDTSHIPYFTENGQIGNSTKASTPKIRPNINDFLDTVVSNLKEMNFDYGLEGWNG